MWIVKRLSIPSTERKLFALAIWNLGRDTVSDTTWTKYRTGVFTPQIMIIKADLSSDSNNNLCPQVQYVSIISPLHTTLKVLATNLPIWPSTSTTKNKRYSQQLINTVAIVKFAV